MTRLDLILPVSLFFFFILLKCNGQKIKSQRRYILLFLEKRGIYSYAGTLFWMKITIMHPSSSFTCLLLVGMDKKQDHFA